MLLLVACAAPEPETPCEAADWFADADGDGFGDAARPTSACERPRAHVADATDCDDARADVSPAGVEACDGVDQDCDGEADEGLFEDRYADADGDGWGDEPVTVCDGSGAPSGGDCDDDDATVSPGAQEVWYDGVDQDCDGRDDDADDDGWGVADDCDDGDATVNPASEEVWYDGVDQDCDGRDDDYDDDGWGVAEDCDDYDSTVNPGRAERWYDGVDQDCDGRDDDADDDGWGAADDCDDDDAAVNPDAEEVWYDGVDQDCDGRDDDADLDGFGVADDCDDTDAATHPDATEIWYDGVDQNCDGRDDDADLDGYGVADDCDDADPDVHPGVAEVCDGVDEDCDGEVDDDPTDGVTTFTDADGDGWGDDATERRACTVDVAVGGDCDDADPDASPDGVEVCGDGADNDCDGLEHGCGWSGTVDASTSAEATLYGGGLTAHMGAALASPGDVDGDGWNDLVVGAPEADYWPTEGGWLRSSVGLVWFTRGPFTGSHDQGAEGSSAFGDQANEDLGTALAAGADLTGDGVGDVLVGSPGTDDLLGTMAAGVVHLVDGTALPGMSDLDADAYGHLYGTGISDNVGSSLVMLGDVDGDGIADWAVGSPGDHGGRRDSGAAFVVSGALTGDLDTTDADTALYGEATYDLAAEVGSAGDTDGDGVAELLVGAAGDDDGATDAGAVYLVHLPAPGSFSLADADAKITGVTASGALSPAAGLGDTDGDGHDDLALGEPGASDAASSAGAVHVFRSSPTGDLPVTAADLRLDGALANDGAGDTVAGPGDVDGDGLADLIVGARIPSGRSDPYAWLVLGSGDTGTASLSTAHVVFTGASGSAVSAFGVGDLDGDGFDDVALGAELAPDPAGGYGLVWLFYGGP